MSELLKVTHLKKVYSAEGYQAEVIRDMSLTVKEGEFPIRDFRGRKAAMRVRQGNRKPAKWMKTAAGWQL